MTREMDEKNNNFNEKSITMAVENKCIHGYLYLFCKYTINWLWDEMLN